VLGKTRKRRPSPSMVVALLALIVAAGGTAYATGEGNPILGGQRNPGSDPSTALTKETQIIANLSGYGTRQSNKSKNGGGAIYGCRSGGGGTAGGNRPCIRANNLSSGYAFEFATTGAQGGLITTGDATGAPFTTNATGVATGLNADRLDGKNATDFLGATDTAANAKTVGGVKILKVQTLLATDAAAQTVLDEGALKLTLTCAAGHPRLVAATATDNSLMRGSRVSVVNDAAVYGSSNFDVADAPVVLFDGAVDGRGTTTFTYTTPAGPVVQGALFVDDQATYGNFAGCSVTGTADVTS